MFCLFVFLSHCNHSNCNVDFVFEGFQTAEALHGTEKKNKNKNKERKERKKEKKGGEINKVTSFLSISTFGLSVLDSYFQGLCHRLLAVFRGSSSHLPWLHHSDFPKTWNWLHFSALSLKMYRQIWSASLERILWFLSFLLLMCWCIRLIDLQILNHNLQGRNESHLLVVKDSFNVVLDSIC